MQISQIDIKVFFEIWALGMKPICYVTFSAGSNAYLVAFFPLWIKTIIQINKLNSPF